MEQTPPPRTMGRKLLRLGLWARRLRLARRAAVLLALAALGSGAATYAVMTGVAPTEPHSDALFWLLNLDVVLLLILGAVVARRVALLWLRRRTGGLGSRLHLRFVALFSALAVAPAILVAVFSALFFDIGVQAWFNKRVQTALAESRAVAEAYLKEHQQVISGQVLAVAADLQRIWPQLYRNPQLMERAFTNMTGVRGLTEGVLFDHAGRVVARAGYLFTLQFEEVPFWALDKANDGEVVVLTGETDDRVRALVKLDVMPETYLYVGRFVDPQVIAHVERTGQAVQEYQRLLAGRSDLEITFSLIFVVVTLLLLFAAVWGGLTLAGRLAQPIGDLIDAAERVRLGNLNVRVPEIAASDEIAVLSRAFNRMTAQITSQQQRLLTTNRELDERRRFTETVLAGVSAGVMSTDLYGNITLINRSARALLRLEASEDETCEGCRLETVVPEFADAMAAALSRRVEQGIQRELQLKRDGKTLTLLLRITAENLEGEAVGYILTFDDITELQAAQRTAAWADVARRIAHEIKNPLTPIQLSAERLKRRYLKQITKDPEIFIQCTDTIVRHVSDIGQMVDEFSSFARMPNPVMRSENLAEIVSQAVFLQRTAYPALTFALDLPQGVRRVACDARQIGQALTNLLKNAVEAIEGRDRPPVGESLPPGRIAVRMEEEHRGGRAMIVVRVADNGRGLPAERDRLTEPYVTTRTKGTGLGLAIVKKILEDHGGDLILEDNPEGGACIVMALPLPAAIPATDPGPGPKADPTPHPEGEGTSVHHGA